MCPLQQNLDPDDDSRYLAGLRIDPIDRYKWLTGGSSSSSAQYSMSVIGSTTVEFDSSTVLQSRMQKKLLRFSSTVLH